MNEMKKHFENIKYLHGNCSVRIPNDIFRNISDEIKRVDGKVNSRHTALAYVYVVTVAFLYKYTHYVDMDNDTYLQNKDIKKLLGYNTTSKTIDKVIKKDGLLDNMGLTRSTRDYPIRFYTDDHEKINNVSLREILTISDIDENDVCYEKIKSIVKNRNYEVKIPTFMDEESVYSDYGTFYCFERTHEITITEFIKLIFNDDFDSSAFLAYAYIKSRCKGLKGDNRRITQYKMVIEIGITHTTLDDRLKALEKKGYITVRRKKWKQKNPDARIVMESNEYTWKGIR